ncbi:MAG: hypothetical protein HEP71_03200 [Roseivirga sp.]|nr:hypothetical protein [Roseivirga sp.]
MIANNRRTARPQSLMDADAAWKDIALNANKDEIKASVYKGTKTINGEKRQLVREELIEMYYGKCAYCENKELKPEVEHYRPKKRVTGKPDHPGYYWLCYEWTNLLPSCRYCNTEGGKGNHFPVAGTHVKATPKVNNRLDEAECKIDSQTLLDEKPYLLNPETDDPTRFIRFNRQGKAIAKGPGEKGRHTIKMCNLNRDNLLYLRQKITHDFRERVEDQFTLYFAVNKDINVLRAGLKTVFERLDQHCADTEPFALMARHIRHGFNTFIANQLSTPIQKDFAKAIRKEYVDGVL